MSEIQALFPVYLGRKVNQDAMSAEDYDTDVSRNEENLNQNLNILFKAIEALNDKVNQGG